MVSGSEERRSRWWLGVMMVLCVQRCDSFQMPSAGLLRLGSSPSLCGTRVVDGPGGVASREVGAPARQLRRSRALSTRAQKRPLETCEEMELRQDMEARSLTGPKMVRCPPPRLLVS